VIDCLAIGALIGWASLNSPALYRLFANWWSLVLSSIILVLAIRQHDVVAMGTAEALFSACFVALAAAPKARGLDWLTFAPLRDLGKISYGVYLYHGFLMPYLHGTPGPLRAAVLIAATIALAALSWVLLERPILRFKDAAPRRPATDRAAAVVAAP
jgi:peptidoglycan/LPS O-acetylase OafA/YrhL